MFPKGTSGSNSMGVGGDWEMGRNKKTHVVIMDFNIYGKNGILHVRSSYAKNKREKGQM